MISVGLTGGIGSGKSTVAKVFSVLDVPVYNSDERAKYLMNHDQELTKRIKELLSEDAYTSKGLNNNFIAEKIFSDSDLRNSLNNLVHKSVLQDYENYLKMQSDKLYAIQESAILFEEGYEKLYDLMITVSSPVEIRTNRLKARGMSEKDIRNRMESQWSDEEKVKRADFVVVNDENQSVLSRVLEIHNKILASYI